MATATANRRSLFDPAIVRQAAIDSFAQARPAPHGPQPGDVRRRDRQRVRHDPVACATSASRRRSERVRRPRRRVALVHRPLRQLRRSGGRGPREGAGGDAAPGPQRDHGPPAHRRWQHEDVPSSQLGVGDECVVSAGDIIPSDGEVVEGIASVDESAITGESAPVIRESGGDRSAVTGGTRVLSDRIVVRITARAGRDVPRPHDRPRRRRQPAEDAERDRAEHPARRPDDHLPARDRDAAAVRHLLRRRAGLLILVALLVCLIPTTIGALLSAIGIAGMDRLVQRNVLAMSGRAVEAAGDCATLLLDKTGTITLGNRQAAEFLPLPGVEERARRSRPAGQPGRRDAGGPLHRGAGQGALRPARTRARTRRAGPVHRADAHERRRPRRAAGAQGRGRLRPPVGRGAGRHRARRDLDPIVEGIATAGGTPLAVAADPHGVRQCACSASSTSRTSSSRACRERFDELRRWASAP